MSLHKLFFLSSHDKDLCQKHNKYSHSFCAWVFFQFYNAKISDFGLAALVPSADDSHVETHLMGTYGYAAPEVYVTGNLFFLVNPPCRVHVTVG